jgi:retron-type reverse transcriptase
VHQLLPKTHIGGRKARSTDHAIHIILEKIYETWNMPEETVASLLLLDVSGAFDNVSHARLLHNLRKRRIDERTVRWIASLLTNRSTNISFNGYKSETYNTPTRNPQGSPLSPILYLFYNADLIETCSQQQNTIATGFIDNVGILQWGRSTQDTYDGLTRTTELATQWTTKHASAFAPRKFQLTHLTRTRQRFDIERLVIMAQQEIIPS